MTWAVQYKMGARTQAAYQAAKCGDLDAVELAFVNPVLHPERLREILAAAALAGQMHIVKHLLAKPQLNTSSVRSDVVRHAATGGHLAMLEWLLEDPHIDLSRADHGALTMAAFGGHLSIVRRLLDDQRIDPNNGAYLTLDYAVFRNNDLVIEALLEHPTISFHAFIDRVLRQYCSRRRQRVDKLFAARYSTIDQLRAEAAIYKGRVMAAQKGILDALPCVLTHIPRATIFLYVCNSFNAQLQERHCGAVYAAVSTLDCDDLFGGLFD